MAVNPYHSGVSDDRLAAVPTLDATAKVGEAHDPVPEPVPSTVGVYDHRPVPNSSTTTYERRWGGPESDTYPQVFTTVSITCQDTESEGRWRVTRVDGVLRRSYTVNVANPQPSLCRDVRTSEQLVSALPSFDDALAYAAEYMRALSAIKPAHPPIPFSPVDRAHTDDTALARKRATLAYLAVHGRVPDTAFEPDWDALFEPVNISRVNDEGRAEVPSRQRLRAQAADEHP